MSNIVTCEHCHGTGKAQCKTCGGSGKTACPKCNGSGKSYHICPDCNNGRVPDPRAIDDDETMTCPTCHGEYRRENGACERCKGTGSVECQPCKGSGNVGCKACNATGKVDIDGIVKSVIVADWYDVTTDKKVTRRSLSAEDVAMLKVAAAQGSGGACYVLGVLEHNGCISYTDEGDAYFEKGAKAGDADCLYAHAVVLSRNSQEIDSWNEMMGCLERSAEKGNVHALIAFVLSSLKGFPVADGKDGVMGVAADEKVLRCCEAMSSLKVKDGQSQYLIARANAIGKYLPRILKNDTTAMTELGNICSDLYDKTGCKHDRTVAAMLIEKAAKGGDVDAIRQMAEYRSNDNLAESIEILDNAAKRGDKKAAERLQIIMQECVKDADRLEELKVCAKAGNVTVMKFLAAAYSNSGNGVKPSGSQVIEWIEMAAKAGDGNSMLDISLKCRKGIGLAKDINKAFVWTCEGFLNGGSRRRALRLLAEFYRYGMFADPDDQKANELYVRSANAGYLSAIVELGRSYLNGWGVQKNLSEAKRLFELAESKGSKEAGPQLLKIPVMQKAGIKPICSITGEFYKDKAPLPDYVKRDYEKAKTGKLWTQEFEAKRKANPVKRGEEEVLGLDAISNKLKKRKTFVALGILGGVFGVHFLYAERPIWLLLYWLMVGAGILQAKVDAFNNLLSGTLPTLSKIPLFALLAGLILIGSIILMKKDGKGRPMM